MTPEQYPVPSNGSLICTFADCPDRRDDSYIEGPGEFYCMIWGDHSKSKKGRNIGATFSCNHNCKNGICPKGFRQ
jgi:hypothetical protein